MISLVDTHAHLFWKSYEKDINEVISKAIAAGVNRAVNVGVDVDLSKAATRQAKEKSGKDFRLYASVAIHPEEAVRYFTPSSPNPSRQLEIDIEELEKIYLENKETVIAIGECGLDFAYFTCEGYLPEGLTVEQAKNLQRQVFKAQISLAKKHNLPLLIHCRDDRSTNFQNSECWDEVIELTKDYKGIYHCYSGQIETTKYILENTDFLISFAGNLTYPKNDYLKEAVKMLPLKRIVLETDCPFLPPQSIRGKRNEPSSVLEIAKTIEEIKGASLENVAEVTTGNFLKLFQLQ